MALRSAILTPLIPSGRNEDVEMTADRHRVGHGRARGVVARSAAARTLPPRTRTFAALLMSLTMSAALGQAPPPELEPLPELEPRYEIVPKGDGKQTLHEFRIDEEAYGYRVQPRRGAPYYLFDVDNNGVLDRINEDDAPVVVPKWELFRWRGVR